MKGKNMRNTRKFAVCLILLLSFFVSTFGIVSLNPELTVWAEEKNTESEQGTPAGASDEGGTPATGSGEGESADGDEGETPAEGNEGGESAEGSGEEDPADGSGEGGNEDGTPIEGEGSTDEDESDDANKPAEGTENEPADENKDETDGKSNDEKDKKPADGTPADGEAGKGETTTNDANKGGMTLKKSGKRGAPAEKPAGETPAGGTGEGGTEDETPADGDEDADKIVEDKNANGALVIISKNKTGDVDWLKENEKNIDNSPKNKPVFVDENGNLYASKELDEAKQSIDKKEVQASLKLKKDGENYVIADPNDAEATQTDVTYKFSLNGKVPQYKIVTNVGGAEKEVQGWTDMGKIPGQASAYQVETQNKDGDKQVHTLAIANRLQDQVVEGGEAHITPDYYVGKGTNLDFIVQLDPSAGLEDVDDKSGEANLTFTLTGLGAAKVQIPDTITYEGSSYNIDKKENEDGTIVYTIKNVPIQGGALLQMNLGLQNVDGKLADDPVQLNIKAERTVGNQVFKNEINRNFILSATKYNDPNVTIEKDRSKNEETDKEYIPEYYAGSVDENGEVAKSHAKTLVADLILTPDQSKWFADNEGELEEINSILRADKPGNMDLKSLTVVVDLPYDETTKTYAQYDPSKFPDNLKWEEIEGEGGKKQLRLQLVCDTVNPDDNTKLEYRQKLNDKGEPVLDDAGNPIFELYVGDSEKPLDNAKITNAILSDGKNMVFLDNKGDSFKVKHEFYTELEESGYKLEGGKLVNVNDAKDAYQLIDGKLFKDGVYYNLSLDPEGKEPTFTKVDDEKDAKRFQRTNDTFFSYKDSFIQGFGNVVNELKDNKPEANTVLDVAVAALDKTYNIILKSKEKTLSESGDDEFYGGTIYDYAAYTKDGKEITDIDGKYTVEDGKVYETTKDENGKEIKTERTDLKPLDDQVRLVYDHLGKLKDFYAKKVGEAGKEVWQFFKRTDEGKPATEAYDNPDISSIEVDEKGDKAGLVIDQNHKILAGFDKAAYDKAVEYDKNDSTNKPGSRTLTAKSADGKQEYQVILDKYYYDEEAKAFMPISKDAEAKGALQDGLFYSEFKHVGYLDQVDRQVIEKGDKEPDLTWKDDEADKNNLLVLKSIRESSREGKSKTLDRKLPVFLGSVNKQDFYKVGDSIYVHSKVKSQTGENPYTDLLTKVGSFEGDKATTKFKPDDEYNPDFLASQDIQITKQVLGDKESFNNLGQLAVYDVFTKNNKIGFKLVGFKPEAKQQYKLGTNFSYTLENDPENEITGNPHTLFTLRNTKDPIKDEVDLAFQKLAPEALKANMNNEVFNLIFRSKDDRERDAILKRLFVEGDEGQTDEKKNLTVEELKFKALFEEEYKKFFNKDFNYETFHKDVTGRLIEWKLRLTSSGGRYGQDNREAIVFEDTHLDNRLVYESLTFNLNRETYKNLLNKAKLESNLEAKQGLEKAQHMAFLEDLESIGLGVDFTKEGGAYNPVKDYTLKGLYEAAQKLVQENQNSEERYSQKELTLTVGKGDEAKQYTYVLSYDKMLGQVTVNLRNFFIEKQEAEEDKPESYISPVQKAYAEEVERVKQDLEDLSNKIETEALTDEQIKEAMREILTGTPLEKPGQNITSCINRSIDAFKKGDGKTAIRVALDGYIDNAKNRSLTSEDEDLNMADRRGLEHAKDYTNRLYNALRIRMKDGVTVSDKRYPDSNMMEIIVNTTLADNVDIPFTDAYGNKLTNRGVALYNETQRQLVDLVNNLGSDGSYSGSDENVKKLLEEKKQRYNFR